MGVLISELNFLLAKHGSEYSKLTDFKSQKEFVISHINKAAGEKFKLYQKI